MCGLFGMIARADASDLAIEAVLWLGQHAVERGRDSAGITYVSRRDNSTNTISGPGLFHKVFTDVDHMGLGRDAEVFLGHTRWATQGSTTDPFNISPMRVGSIIATHNGDIEVASIPSVSTLPTPRGGTDTERLFQAIGTEASLEGVAKILSTMKGRAALAWLDDEQAHTLFLARASLSPLATAIDREGNLYWASNPDWFRKVDAIFDGTIGFSQITMINEGTLAVVDTSTLEIRQFERFTPLCREKDVRLADLAAHRGFTEADKRADLQAFCHSVVPSAPAFTTTGTTAWNWEDRPGTWDDITDRQDWWESEAPDTCDSRQIDLAVQFVLDWADEGCPLSTWESLVEADTIELRDKWRKRYHVASAASLPYILEEMENWMEFDFTSE